MDIPRERAVTSDTLTRTFARTTKCFKPAEVEGRMVDCKDLHPSHPEWSQGLCVHCMAENYAQKWTPFPIVLDEFTSGKFLPEGTFSCQLCTSGVPLSEIRGARGHSVSFTDRPAVVALWVPCSDNDRKLAQQHEKTLRSTTK